ncbi:MAG TPA: alpha/beta hydrolase-fold protein [Candidatus Aquilonibacter sp.]|nr:alpha/beta hydrolase-fold protein [Candidatus Aquilonibacter sp.]
MNRGAGRELAGFLLALAGLLVCAPARAAGRAECSAVPSKILARPVPYCVLLPPSYDAQNVRRFPVVYFLHGIGENEQVLLNSGGWDAIQDLWEQKQLGEFVLAAPAGGRTFFINSRDGKVRYQDFLMREFLPYIESRYRILGLRRTRGIAGISMGGYGALRLALLFPHTFGAVSANSPALIAELPHMKATQGESSLLARLLGSAFGVPFDSAFWYRESPFTIVRDSSRPAGLQIYYDCGTEDSYGFNAGAQAFDRLLVSRGIRHEFHLYPGSHDWTYFAQHFPASLEFQSDAFGITPKK